MVSPLESTDKFCQSIAGGAAAVTAAGFVTVATARLSTIIVPGIDLKMVLAIAPCLLLCGTLQLACSMLCTAILAHPVA